MILPHHLVFLQRPCYDFIIKSRSVKQKIMKTAGIIAEYNPFHCGHKFHIEETRRLTGADYIITVMSGNFVQRGAPAILNKYERAQMALENGADLVIELPTAAALSSAEGFACGGVSVLAGLNVATDLSFGCEISSPEDIRYLQAAAKLFVAEPPAFKRRLSFHLRRGLNFPAARLAAAKDYLSGTKQDLEKLHGLLSTPNNILAVEYWKAIYKYGYPIRPCAVCRKGNGYHDQAIRGTTASATAIRNFLLQDNGMAGRVRQLEPLVPGNVFGALARADEQKQFLSEDDFSDMLYHALTEHFYDLDQFGSISPEFTPRLQKQLEHFEAWSQFAALLKTKNRTYASVSRYFSHILTGITREGLAQAAGLRFAPYARILGFQKTAAPLLKEMQFKSRIPVVMKLARDMENLKDCQKNLLELDLRASQLYNHILFAKSGCRPKSDFRRPLICL